MRWFLDRRRFDREVAHLAWRPSGGVENPRVPFWRRVTGRDGAGFERVRRFAMPDGGFYVFFEVEGESDSRSLALRLVDEAGIGLAPGVAFGDPGASFMRLCFARDPIQLEEAASRLTRWLRR